MEDILKRLSRRCDCANYIGGVKCQCCAAANEIESLRANISRLEAELAKADGQINRCVDQNKYLERQLTEARKPDCRLCEHCGKSGLTAEFMCLRQPPIVCINGDAHIPLRPLRLYEKEWKV